MTYNFRVLFAQTATLSGGALEPDFISVVLTFYDESMELIPVEEEISFDSQYSSGRTTVASVRIIPPEEVYLFRIGLQGRAPVGSRFIKVDLNFHIFDGRDQSLAFIDLMEFDIQYLRIYYMNVYRRPPVSFAISSVILGLGIIVLVATFVATAFKKKYTRVDFGDQFTKEARFQVMLGGLSNDASPSFVKKAELSEEKVKGGS